MLSGVLSVTCSNSCNQVPSTSQMKGEFGIVVSFIEAIFYRVVLLCCAVKIKQLDVW